MPINIATGQVEQDRSDLWIAGAYPLTWRRAYRTALLGSKPTALGLGWTNNYFCRLKRTPDGYAFTTGVGEVQSFADPERLLERGATLRDFGTSQELVKAGETYVVTKWNVETGEISRFVFRPVLGSGFRLASLEDVCGRGLDLFYDQAVRLIGIRQRNEERSLELLYSKHGYIEAVIFHGLDGSRETKITYRHDAEGRLIEDTDAAGSSDRYEYDQHGRITREISKDGGVLQYRYDDRGRCVYMSGLDRYNARELVFQESTRTTIVTDSLGKPSIYVCTPDGQIARESNALGHERRFEYDEHGRVVAKIQANGGVVRYSYDEYGNRDAITDPQGNSWHYAFNQAHLPLTLTDPNGRVWRQSYDEQNRLIATQDPLDACWRFGYDSRGNLVHVTDPRGAELSRKFAQGVLEEQTDWMGHIFCYSHDAEGRLVERVGPLGEKSGFRYDRLGHPTAVIFPDGTSWRLSYDNAGNLISYADAQGRLTQFRYGPCRRILQRTDPARRTISYRWSTEPGLLDALVNEAGEICEFFYDAAGRLIREKGFDGREEQFAYDPSGYCTGVTNGAGETIALERFPNGRLRAQCLPDGTSTTYDYDPAGRLLAAVNAEAAVRFEYDAVGRTIRESQGEDWVRRAFDAVGNPIRTTTSRGHDAKYAFDGNGRLTELAAAGQKLGFERNARGEEIGRSLPGQLKLEQRYDVAGRLTEQRLGPAEIPSGPMLVQRAYRYDLTGNLLSVQDRDAGTVDYTYDPAERLISAIRSAGLEEHFEYGPTGNLVRVRQAGARPKDESLTYAPGNRLVRKGNTTYEYDAQGRLVKKTENASSEHPSVWMFAWDALDQLRELRCPDGQVWRYIYDAFGRRIRKQGPQSATTFLWDGYTVVHSWSENRADTWIHEPGTFRLLATIQSKNFYSAISDDLGTPQELVSAQGEVAWRAQREAWGAAEPAPGSKAYCPIRFQGQWHDEESGFHYNWQRYYDPDTARFISPDPIGLVGGPNLYTYAPNPTNWVDPLGLAKCSKGKQDPAKERPAESPFYSVVMEAKLEPGTFEKSDANHFRQANRQLNDLLKSDPKLAANLEKAYPGISEHVTPGPRGGIADTSPPGLTWHHDPTTPGNVQLVPRDQHQAPGPVQNSLHPDQKGGREIWGGGR